MIPELVEFAALWMLAVTIGLWLVKRDNERNWINYLADQSGAGWNRKRRGKYSRAGYFGK